MGVKKEEKNKKKTCTKRQSNCVKFFNAIFIRNWDAFVSINTCNNFKRAKRKYKKKKTKCENLKRKIICSENVQAHNLQHDRNKRQLSAFYAVNKCLNAKKVDKEKGRGRERKAHRERNGMNVFKQK